MPTFYLLLLGVVSLSVLGQAAADAQLPPQEQLAITDVTAIDVEGGRALAHQTVLVSQGRIDAVGAREIVRVPPGARRIDGR